MTMLPPGSTIGILGSGQLGRMLAVAAAQLGYRAHIYAPESGPACDVAAAFTRGDYQDAEAGARFADAVDVITYEFENVDPRPLAALAARRPLWPPIAALETAQHRLAEKDFVRAGGGTTAPYRGVADRAALDAAIAGIGTPAILKTTMFGYDGKGQARIDTPGDADAAWAAIGSPSGKDCPAILEARVAFDAEFSVILCRGQDGAIAVWDTPENVHRDGILATSTVPASPAVLNQAPTAVAMAREVAERLGHVGVLTLEFFATAQGPVVNEMAPRVHNSGHWTIEGSETSQFENHIRAICGLPLGGTARVGRRVTMENLIGDEALRWREPLAEPGAHLHLYGKHDIRPGRKMGHVTRVAG